MSNRFCWLLVTSTLLLRNMTAQKLERQKCEVYSRVVGYLSPIHRWNKGKREEFGDRKTYDRALK